MRGGDRRIPGASIRRAPRAATRDASVATYAGGTVEDTMTMAPGTNSGAAPRSPNSTSSICAASTTSRINGGVFADQRSRRRESGGARGHCGGFGTRKNIARTHFDAVAHEALHHAEAHRAGTDDADPEWHGGATAWVSRIACRIRAWSGRRARSASIPCPCLEARRCHCCSASRPRTGSDTG